MEDKETNKMVEKVNCVENKSISVDGGWGWVVCFSGFLCNVISFGIFMTFGIFLEPLMKHYNASHRYVKLFQIYVF